MLADFFQNKLFQKILSGTQLVSNGLYPDKDRHFLPHDLGPNHLQRLSAYDKSRR